MASFSVQSLVISAKAKAILQHRLLQKIAAVLRLIELVVFAIMVSRFFTQLPVTARAVRDYLRDVFVSDPFLSPRLVFVVGSAIVIALFAKSGQFSPHDAAAGAGGGESVSIAAAASAMNTCYGQIKDSGWYSTREDCMAVEQRRPGYVLRRSATERPPEREGEKLLLRCYSEEHMSGEEFKRRVDEFIARQQRFLRGDETAGLHSPRAS